MYYCGTSPHHDEVFSRELQEVKLMNKENHSISRDVVYDLLQKCLSKKDLASSRFVNCLMISNGLNFVTPLGDHLIRVFTLCGSLLEANRAFLKIPMPSIFTWNVFQVF